jgi:hypothetical protein
VPAVAIGCAGGCRIGGLRRPVDSYTRAGNRIEGRLVARNPRTVVVSYIATLDASGRPVTFEQQARLPDGSVVPNAPRSVTVSFTRDSVVARVERDTVATIRAAAADAFPFINNALSLYALPLGAFAALGRDSVTLTTYSAGQPRAGSLPIARKGPNRYWVYLFGAPQEVVTDDRGRVLSVDGSRTTLKVQATRVPFADVSALATLFAQREAASRPSGPLSPRDTVHATIGAAQLWLDYSRPLARGRRVFGPNGVLGDTLWRTGANAATQFRTSVPLVVGGQSVPAGTYTLWTIAVPGRYQLVFNRQIGQWGTVYDPAQDLVRVPLGVLQLTGQPIERFTIAIDQAAAGGVIRLRWDDTELSVPFTVP